MTLPTDAGFRQRVEIIVGQIPPGRVMTYGQIAALCGNPRAARIVGGIAHFGDADLPWQRVVNRSGGLASGYPGGRAGHKQALEAEGITVSQDYRVTLDNLLWRPPQPSASRIAHAKDSDQVPPLLVVVGETASGKSALALRLAQHFDGEIICADSWTVRREADIGTAKPTEDDKAAIAHHLLDVVGPDEDFTAAVFKQMAQAAITDIAGRGRLPIMVGGTGLYIDSVLYDYGFLPRGDRQDRQELNRLSTQQLLQMTHDMDLELGGIDTGNKRRLIRLIETKGLKPTKKPIRSNTLIIGLRSDRDVLNKRIIKRTDAMIAAGLEDEVSNLAERYGWEAEALKGIGYAQWRGYFLGSDDMEQVRMSIIKASLDLAKRQRTWFRRNKGIQWFNTPVKWTDVVESVTTFLKP